MIHEVTRTGAADVARIGLRVGGRSAHDANVMPVKINGAIHLLGPSPTNACEAAAPE